MTPTRFLVYAALFVGGGAMADPRPVERIADKVAAAQQRMHTRFAATATIRTSIALADTERANAEAKLIAQLAEPDFLPEWQPYVDGVRRAAAQVAIAADPIAAAKMTALLGRRCAQCHEASGAKIAFPKVPRPSDSPRLRTQMTDHEWAAARLWEGLVGPSPALWSAGASALVDGRIAIVAEGGELGVADDVARLRLYATRAKKADTLDARAELYGQILGTCARCHAAIRDR
jgi:cytochrome c553